MSETSVLLANDDLTIYRSKEEIAAFQYAWQLPKERQISLAHHLLEDENGLAVYRGSQLLIKNGKESDSFPALARLIAEGKDKKGRRGGAAAKSLGDHPEDGKTVTVRDGRFGPYVQHGSLRATLPRDKDKDAITLEEALELLAIKAAKGAPKKKATTKKKTATKKKTTTKKTAKKKVAAKKKSEAKSGTAPEDTGT